MRISEYIEALSDLMCKHGDLEVETYQIDMTRIKAPEPKLRFTRILKGREHKPRFFNETIDTEDRRGDKVIYV